MCMLWFTAPIHLHWPQFLQIPQDNNTIIKQVSCGCTEMTQSRTHSCIFPAFTIIFKLQFVKRMKCNESSVCSKRSMMDWQGEILNWQLCQCQQQPVDVGANHSAQISLNSEGLGLGHLDKAFINLQSTSLCNISYIQYIMFLLVCLRWLAGKCKLIGNVR